MEVIPPPPEFQKKTPHDLLQMNLVKKEEIQDGELTTSAKRIVEQWERILWKAEHAKQLKGIVWKNF